jgi:hypothetical protein
MPCSKRYLQQISLNVVLKGADKSWHVKKKVVLHILENDS